MSDPRHVSREIRRSVALVLVLALAACARGPLATPEGSTSGLPATPSTTVPPSSSVPTLPESTPNGAPPLPPTAPATLQPPPTASATDSFAILPAPAGIRIGSIACSGAIGASDPVAIVELYGAADGVSVLRDYADVSHPRTVCTLRSVQLVQLIDARHLVVQGDGPSLYAIVDLPAVRYHWFQLPEGHGLREVLAVAPQLGEIAWMQWAVQDPEPDPFDRLHLTTAAGDRIVATLPDTNEGRCGSPMDSNRAGYTRSGSALFVLDEPLPEISLVIVKGGKVVLSLIGDPSQPIASRPLKVLWSPVKEELYWSQSGSIWRWTASEGSDVILKGVVWESATISPDGSHLAYDVTVAEGFHDTYLMDLDQATAPVRIGGGHRTSPVFVNDAQLFYIPEYQQPGCTGEAPPRPLIYNVTDGTEAVSIIDYIWRVWPATATNN